MEVASFCGHSAAKAVKDRADSLTAPDGFDQQKNFPTPARPNLTQPYLELI